jgi:hypothetical protein
VGAGQIEYPVDLLHREIRPDVVAVNIIRYRLKANPAFTPIPIEGIASVEIVLEVIPLIVHVASIRPLWTQ